MAQLDWDTLLKPISEDTPCGVDLELDDSPTGPHWQILEARREAKSDEESDPAQAEQKWRKLEKLCCEALAKRSKDMRYVAFLIESRLRTTGLDGVSDGLELCAKLTLTFGEQLFPRTEGGGLEETLLPINQLDGKILEQPIRKLLVTQGSQHRHMLWQLANAQKMEQEKSDVRELAKSRGEPTLAEVKGSATETPVEFYITRMTSLENCRSKVEDANATILQVAGKRLTSFSKIRAVLGEMESAVVFLAGPRLPAKEAPPATDPSQPSTAGNPAVSVTGQPFSGSIANRKDAFHQLTVIAEFFERTEPQSVLPAQIRRVIRWGHLNPGELYREIIDNADVRTSMFRLIGIEVPQA